MHFIEYRKTKLTPYIGSHQQTQNLQPNTKQLPPCKVLLTRLFIICEWNMY